MNELEEFHKFKKEYEQDPIFAAYQMHKMIECLIDTVRNLKEINDETKKAMKESDLGINLTRHVTVDDLAKDLGL